jgi:hypothetical protein
MLSKLREMIEKTIKIENALRESINESQEQIDYYRPCGDVVYPPKKKVRFQ